MSSPSIALFIFPVSYFSFAVEFYILIMKLLFANRNNRNCDCYRTASEAGRTLWFIRDAPPLPVTRRRSRRFGFHNFRRGSRQPNRRIRSYRIAASAVEDQSVHFTAEIFEQGFQTSVTNYFKNSICIFFILRFVNIFFIVLL